MNAPPPLRFGIVGCGAIAPTHGKAIRELGHELVAVADSIPERARRLIQTGAVKMFDDVVELAHCEDVDAVCICTPSGLHADHAVACLRAGKHVLIEKPLDITLEACDRVVAVAGETKRVCAVVSQHRFDAASQLAKRLIDSGKIGRIVLATGDVKWWRTQAYYDEGDWRGTRSLDGGGALMNQAIHTVDLLQWLAGDVVSVHARCATAAHERIDVEDVAVVSIAFTSGAMGCLTATTAAYDGFAARVEIFGTDGSILIEGDNLKRLALKSGEGFDVKAAAAHAVAIAKSGTAGVGQYSGSVAIDGSVWGDAHRAQIEDFAAAIREKRSPMVTAADGRKPVAIVLAAYESARTNGSIEIAGV